MGVQIVSINIEQSPFKIITHFDEMVRIIIYFWELKLFLCVQRLFESPKIWFQVVM